MIPLLSYSEFMLSPIIGYNPWHAWGITADVGAAKITSACNTAIQKYPWLNADAAGRVDVEAAIIRAEQIFFDHARFWPAPKYVVKSNIQWPRYPDVRLDNWGYAGSDGRWISVNVGESYIQKIGVETRTLIEAARPLTYSDRDNDTIDETFTFTVATTVTDPSELAIYFSLADRWDNPAVGEEYRVRPLHVTISGGVATITGKRWIVVRPVLYEGVSPEDGINALDNANFATTLDVYRLFIDPTGITVDTAQAELIYETSPWPYYACACNSSTNSYDPAALASATGRAGIRDSLLGEVSIGRSVYNATSGLWGSPACGGGCSGIPDRLTIRYQAGYPLDSSYRMDDRVKRTIAKLAAAELPQRLCACDSANRAWYHWQFDLARTEGGGDESYGAISPEDLNNPLGSKRGQVMAWKEIVNGARVLTGFSTV